MHLSEVILKNWRSYRSAQFRFPIAKDEKRKVVLIGAMNGTGKTSLLTSLYLGLFGRDGMYHVEGVRRSDEEERQRSYRLLMERVLHRSAVNEDDPQISVQLVFDLGEEAPLTITRVWNFHGNGKLRDLSGDAEEVIIERNNKPQRFHAWQEANNKIEDLLFPAYVLPCFFFDGEQAQKRVEEAGGAALADAMQTLFGTRLLRGLRDTLQSYSTLKRSKLNGQHKEVREEELVSKVAKHDALESLLAELRADLSKVRAQLQVAEAQRRTKQDELVQISGHASVDSSILIQEKSSLEAQERNLQDQLQRDLAALALPIALTRLESRVRVRLEGEITRDRWLVLKDDIAKKVDGVVEASLPKPNEEDISPALTLTQREQVGRRIRAAMEAIWNPAPESCAPHFHFLFLNPSDRLTILAKIGNTVTADGQKVTMVVAEWEETKRRLAEVRRKWESVQDVQPKLRAVRDRVDALQTQVAELNEQRSEHEQREKGILTELADLRAAIGKMEASRKERGPEEGRIELADRIRRVIGELEECLKPLCEDALAECCTKHFAAMISSEYRQHRVEFDGEGQPRVVFGNQEPVYVTTMSGAQKRAFGLAFTLAVAEESGQNAPIVIDTPVGSMDSEFRKRVLRYMAETAPGQLFFLSHDEEIYGEYVHELEPYLTRRFLVEFKPTGDGIGESNVQSGRYFAERA